MWRRKKPEKKDEELQVETFYIIESLANQCGSSYDDCDNNFGSDESAAKGSKLWTVAKKKISDDTTLQISYVSETVLQHDNDGIENDDDTQSTYRSSSQSVKQSSYRKRSKQGLESDIFECAFLEDLFDRIAVAIGCQDECSGHYGCGNNYEKAVLL